FASGVVKSIAHPEGIRFARQRTQKFPNASRGLPLASAERFHAVDWSDGMARKDGIVSRAKSARSLPPLGAIGEDTPLRLNVAAALAYPDGSMTTSGLRREPAR